MNRFISSIDYTIIIVMVWFRDQFKTDIDKNFIGSFPVEWKLYVPCAHLISEPSPRYIFSVNRKYAGTVGNEVRGTGISFFLHARRIARHTRTFFPLFRNTTPAYHTSRFFCLSVLLGIYLSWIYGTKMTVILLR
jgi:hypothetical protein